METKLACMQVKVSKETGELMLFIETAYSLRPVVDWPKINTMEDFAVNIIAYFCEGRRKTEHLN